MNKDKTKLAPCPGCRKTATRVIASVHKDTFYAECTQSDCHMSGPIGETHAAAVERWNALPRSLVPTIYKQLNKEPCGKCGHEFDQAALGMYGCPNCHGEGLS